MRPEINKKQQQTNEQKREKKETERRRHNSQNHFATSKTNYALHTKFRFTSMMIWIFWFFLACDSKTFVISDRMFDIFNNYLPRSDHRTQAQTIPNDTRILMIVLYCTAKHTVLVRKLRIFCCCCLNANNCGRSCFSLMILTAVSSTKRMELLGFCSF